MKKFKASLAALLAVCSLLGLAGCSEKNEQSPNDGGASQSTSSEIPSSSSSNESANSDQNGSQSSVSENDNSSRETGSSGEVPESGSQTPEQKPDGGNEDKTQDLSNKLTNSNTENSIRVFDKISADKENSMLSPLSLNMALGLLEARAKGNTKAQFDSYLQTNDYADFAESYIKRVSDVLTKEERKGEYSNYPRSTVEIANSFWANSGLPLKDAYKKTVAEKFGAEIQNVDFGNSEETLKKINGWVNEKTHEMIPSILNSCDDSMEAVLINTVYFESPWNHMEWIVDEGDEGFTLLDGTVKQVRLMRSYGDYYYENGSATAFSRSYDNGLEFVGILPKKSGDFTLESLDIPTLLESCTDRYYVTAKMPRLDFESEFSLNDALMEAGLTDMFGGADFSDISSSPLMVSDVIQKTKLELDENGTKAAAVTAEIMTGGGPSYDGKREVFLDRPFAFLIYDSEQDQILFMGKVTNVDK